MKPNLTDQCFCHPGWINQFPEPRRRPNQEDVLPLPSGGTRQLRARRLQRRRRQRHHRRQEAAGEQKGNADGATSTRNYHSLKCT